MRRSDFSLESKLFGSDFNKALDKWGGKATGLMLLGKIIKKRRERVHFLSDIVRPAPYFAIQTGLYQTVEDLFQRVLSNPLEAYKKAVLDGRTFDRGVKNSNEAMWNFPFEVLKEILIQDPAYRRSMGKEIGRTLAEFSRDYGKRAEFHIRSSSTVEDWKDDRYYGTFRTIQNAKILEPRSRQLLESLLILMHSFYSAKFHSDPTFELGNRDSLGAVVMPSIGGRMSKHLTVYSSYPEDENSPTAIEVCSRGMESKEGAIDLIFVKDGKIEVSPASRSIDYGKPEYTEEVYQEMRPYTIDGQRSSISRRDILEVQELSREIEDLLCSPVNLEMILDVNWGRHDHSLYPVQLRPVPQLPEDREVKNLEPLPESAHLIAETPFVIGSYKKTAPLVIAADKRGYRGEGGHRFKEPVIIWHAENNKGHGYYAVDPNCIAMLNPSEGAALTHDQSLLPPFGERRQRFAFMGVPGLRGELYACLRLFEEKDGRGYVNRFGRTPFNITMESDGRRGRLYIDKADLPKFNDRTEKLPERFC